MYGGANKTKTTSFEISIMVISGVHVVVISWEMIYGDDGESD
jgi:hypothetical protein